MKNVAIVAAMPVRSAAAKKLRIAVRGDITAATVMPLRTAAAEMGG